MSRHKRQRIVVLGDRPQAKRQRIIVIGGRPQPKKRHYRPQIELNGRFRVYGKLWNAYRNRVRTDQQLDDSDCRYCGQRRGATLDHVRPLAKGGGDEQPNLMLCCDRCNKHKADRTLTEWAAELRTTLANVERIASRI